MDIKKAAALLCAAIVIALDTGCSHESPPSSTEDSTRATAPGTEAASDAAAEVTTAPEAEETDLSRFSTFELSSGDLHDGVWDTVITKTENGENRSPQLSWESVDGAGCYVIYMADTTAGNWLHWKSVTESETELPSGWAPEKEYIGPYPPSGTHDYEIFVLALKEQPERIKGAFDSANPKFFEFLDSLDGGGNIISYGHLTGTYTKGE